MLIEKLTNNFHEPDSSDFFNQTINIRHSRESGNDGVVPFIN